MLLTVYLLCTKLFQTTFTRQVQSKMLSDVEHLGIQYGDLQKSFIMFRTDRSH